MLVAAGYLRPPLIAARSLAKSDGFDPPSRATSNCFARILSWSSRPSRLAHDCPGLPAVYFAPEVSGEGVCREASVPAFRRDFLRPTWSLRG